MGADGGPFLEKFTLYFPSKPLNASKQESKLTVEKYREAGKCHKSEETGPGSNPGAPGPLSADVLLRGSCGARRLAAHSCALCQHQASHSRSTLCLLCGPWRPSPELDFGPKRCLSGCQRGEKCGTPTG